MAVIRYQCTACNRQIEIIEQPRGLEHIGPCNITNKCRGRLYKVARLQDYAVGKFPADVVGLTNHIKRNVVHDHIQSIGDRVWLIEHNLGVNPSVQVLVDREETVGSSVVSSRIEIEPELITIIDKNTLSLTFARAESGIAQVVARSTSISQTVETVEAGITYLPASTEGILTLGVDLCSGQFPDGTIDGTFKVRLYFLDEESLSEDAFTTAVYKDYNARTPVTTSAWSDTTEVFVNGETYTVLTIDLGDPVNDIGAPSAGTVMFHAGKSTSDFPYDQAPNLVVLLSNYPHANADKVRTRVFRPDLELGPTLSLDSFIFANGDLSVDQAVTERTFPPVFSITASQASCVADPVVVIPNPLCDPNNWQDDEENSPPDQWEAVSADSFGWDDSGGFGSNPGKITYIGTDPLPDTITVNWVVSSANFDNGDVYLIWKNGDEAEQSELLVDSGTGSGSVEIEISDPDGSFYIGIDGDSSSPFSAEYFGEASISGDC